MTATGPITGYGIGITYHRFASDRLTRLYGNQIDAIATIKCKRHAFAARAACYPTDTTKIFVQLDWAL